MCWQCLCILAKWYACNIFCCLFDTFECSSTDWTQLLIIWGRMRKSRRWIISVSSCPINRSGRPWSPCWKGTRSWWWPTTLATSHPQAQFLISYIIILYTISAGTMTRTFSFSKEGIEEVNIYSTETTNYILYLSLSQTLHSRKQDVRCKRIYKRNWIEVHFIGCSLSVIYFLYSNTQVTINQFLIQNVPHHCRVV